MYNIVKLSKLYSEYIISMTKRYIKVIAKHLNNFIVDISSIPLSCNHKLQELIKFNRPVCTRITANYY